MHSRGLIDELLELLFPPRCQLCQQPGNDPLCETCLEDALFIGDPICDLCGAPMPEQRPAGQLCEECRDGRILSAARAVGLHELTLRRAVHHYKYQGRTRLAQPFGAMLARVIRRATERGLPMDRCAALVPVPLHPRRRAWRGFDQAELLCRHISPLIDLPVAGDVLRRVRHTTPQTSVQGAHERRENVRGAFEASGAKCLRGRALILVDDVFTTGATIEECASVLRNAGTVAVYAVTITRTTPHWMLARNELLEGRDDAPGHGTGQA